MASVTPHPLSDLSVSEINHARNLVLKLHPGAVIDFRAIYLLEPPKADVIPFLELEHAGKLSPSTPRPPRLAQVKYDVIGGQRAAEYHESVVDVAASKRIRHHVIGPESHANLSM